MKEIEDIKKEEYEEIVKQRTQEQTELTQ